MNRLKISGEALRWFTNYLEGRLEIMNSSELTVGTSPKFKQSRLIVSEKVNGLKNKTDYQPSYKIIHLLNGVKEALTFLQTNM